MIKRGKKGAIELSIGTMIIIVLGVSMLIFGLILIRNIYGIATDSIDTIGSEVMSQINEIFADENQKLVIMLGRDKVAKVRAGTDSFGIAIGAQTISANRIDSENDVQFMIMIDTTEPANCYNILGPSQTENLFMTPVDTWFPAVRFSDSDAGAIIRMKVPSGTTLCSQVVKVQAKDFSIKSEGEVIAQDYFTVEVLREALF